MRSSEGATSCWEDMYNFLSKAARYRGTVTTIIVVATITQRLNPQQLNSYGCASSVHQPVPNISVVNTTVPSIALSGPDSIILNSTNETLIAKEPLKMNVFPTDNDNNKIPGLFMDNKLYILGARLTSSYDKFDESLSFDMFGHAVSEGASPDRTMDAIETKSLLTYKQASKKLLFCRVHTEEGPTEELLMEYIPIQSVDSTTANTHLIWRCNLSPYLSRSNVLKSQQSYVRISVHQSIPGKGYTSETSDSNDAKPNDQILIVDVPLDTSTVGHAGPFVKNSNSLSFLQTIAKDGPLGIVLCVAGLAKSSLWYLPEFLQHHINLGVQHFFLGVDVMEDLPIFQKYLAYFIEQNVVVLGGEAKIQSSPHNAEFNHREVRKIRFYDQCLYHAKGMSEFLAIWDIDELWIPPTNSYKDHPSLAKNSGSLRPLSRRPKSLLQASKQIKNDTEWAESIYSTAMNLPEAARSLRGKGGCVDWCYQTFPSYIVKKQKRKQNNATTPEEQGYYGFPVRERELNHRWQKPIIRTQYAHQASFHVAGSCRRPEMPSRSTNVNDHDDHTEGYSRWFGDCPLLTEPTDSIGSMHHLLTLFRPTWKLVSREDLENYSVDEYSTYFRPTVLKQLERLPFFQLASSWSFVYN